MFASFFVTVFFRKAISSKVDIRDDKITIYKRKRLLFIVSNCMQDKKVIPIIYVDANVTLMEDALYSL